MNESKVLNYNICIVKYVHSMAWWELGELIFFSLKELGFNVKIQHQFLEDNCINIIFGAFLLDEDYIKKLPKNSIIVNTEQLLFESDYKKRWPSNIIDWAKEFETWDYNDENISMLRGMGVLNVKKLDIGFQSELKRISKNKIQDIDILFYGSRSQKRLELLDLLKNSGLKVEILFGVYGEKRDEYISRSKVILNCHNYNSELFEIVRCFYLMTNRKAIVSEINQTTKIDQRYKLGIYGSPYEELVENCIKVAKNIELREVIQLNYLSWPDHGAPE
jgi:hypothetical protein